MRELTFTFIILFLPILGLAQGPDEVEYDLEYSFSGTVRGKTDSLFQVFLVVDEKEFEKLQRFYVKMGSQPGLSDLFITAIDKNTLTKRTYDREDEKEKLLSRQEDKVYIDLGIYPSGEHYIQVKSKDEQGRFVRSRNVTASR